MTKINTETFLKEWELIDIKLDMIKDILQEGNDFDGYCIYPDRITIKSSTYFSGCGTDIFSLDVLWDEINEPKEYFEEKRNSIKRTEEDKQKKIEQEQKKEQDKKDKQEFERLRKKFGY